MKFADDVILMAKRFEELSEMVTELIEKGKVAGLEVNLQKTKLITNDRRISEVKIGNHVIEKKDDAVYLAQQINMEEKTT